MPFEGERATGESLIRLRNSKAIDEFNGVILHAYSQEPIEPPIIDPLRRNWRPRRVIAIDGSNLMHPVKNGLPAAEAGLLTASVVAIDLEKLQRIPKRTRFLVQGSLGKWRAWLHLRQLCQAWV